MLDHLPTAERERRLFEIVDHANRGLAPDATRSASAELRALNLAAARRAQSSAAFAPAHGYFQRAAELLADDAWASDYDQTLAIHVEGARAAYLSGEHATMDALVDVATRNAKTPIDRVNAREVKVHSLVSQRRFADAVRLAVDVLTELGVELPLEPTREEVEREVTTTLGALQKLSGDDIGRLAMANDPKVVAVQRLENALMSSAYLAAPSLLPILACSIVRSTLASGVCKESPYGFAVLGIVLNAVNLIDVSYAMGKVAIEMLGRIDDRSVQPKNLHVVNGLLKPFVEPVRESVEAERRVSRLAMDTGDLEYASWPLHQMVCNGLYAGLELAEVWRTYERNRATLERHEQLPALGCTRQFGQAVLNLTGKAADPARLVGLEFDEAAMMPELRAINFRGAAFIVTAVGTYLRYLFRDLGGARAFADEGGEFLDGAPATYHQVWWHQYRALAILGAAEASAAGARDALAAIERNVAQLRLWHRFSAVNHDHRVHLVDAEIARVEGRAVDAVAHHEAAIARATENGFVHEGALASELAARFHFARGAEARGREHLLEACAAYGRWGATAKVAHLRAELGHRLG
jgi:predicted ATPase